MGVRQRTYVRIRIITKTVRIIRKVKNLWDVLEQVQKVAEILLAKLWISLGIGVTVLLVLKINEKR